MPTSEHAEGEPIEPRPTSPIHISDDEGAEGHSPRSDISEELRWGLKRVLDDLDNDVFQKQGLPQEGHHTGLADESLKRYIDHFHHHWHIIHAPTYEFHEQPFGNAAIIYLIGAFCWNQGDKTLEIESSLFSEIHTKLVNLMFRWLVSFKPHPAGLLGQNPELTVSVSMSEPRSRRGAMAFCEISDCPASYRIRDLSIREQGLSAASRFRTNLLSA